MPKLFFRKKKKEKVSLVGTIKFSLIKAGINDESPMIMDGFVRLKFPIIILYLKSIGENFVRMDWLNGHIINKIIDVNLQRSQP